ncbi:histidine phosphatase family protein [Actinotalea sp. M2MS4P-6]|uniref:histidine phosphatase family protein n=1 Tax=Actinotalea sp. M2MS4P-6 TaxID=2983762 RepID=UPI0021E358EC|nr:histidine phosphatase family protein [Actinotalea sp. M2MS4P-6]MCV2393724.1 histidine phosphatase family protein [Actinotalea sp. M2MS4P-6]
MASDRSDGHLTLYLVRHGRTVFNDQHRIQGWADSAITDEGMRIVEATAEHLASIELHAAYASPSGRTLTTADVIASYHADLEVVAHDGLREFYFGDWEERPEQEIAEQLDWLVLFQDVLAGTYPGFPNGESARTYLDRVTGAFDEIEERHGAGENVLVVSHGMTLMTYLALNGQFPRRALGNASVTIMRIWSDGTRSIEVVGHDPSGEGVAEPEIPRR